MSAVDSRGVARGCCNFPGCSCFGYDGTGSNGGKCDRCGHPPPRHAKTSMMASAQSPPSPQPVMMTLAADSDDDNEVGSLSLSGASEDGPTSVPVPVIRKIIDSMPYFRLNPPLPRDQSASLRARRSSSPEQRPRPPQPKLKPRRSPASRNAWAASAAPFPACRYPNCENPQFFDVNTGVESAYCSEHMYAPPPPPPLISPDQFSHSMGSLTTSMIAPDGMSFHTTPLPTPSPQYLPPQRLVQTDMYPPPQPLFHPSQSAPNIQTQQQHQPVQPTPSAPGKLERFCFMQTGGLIGVFPHLVLLPDGERCIYPLCNKRRYKEPDGRVHEFCGRYHANEYKKLKGGKN